MFDFTFGTKKEILNNPKEFIIFVKRLLPRYMNGIPDSQCESLWDILQKNCKKKNPTIIETGVGASTIPFFLFAVITKGKFFSWDVDGGKISSMRQVISEAICKPLDIDVYKYWEAIKIDSTDTNAGIPILKDLKRKVSFAFLDTWHTYQHLKGEIEGVEKVSDKKFILAIDDAYYNKKYQNYSYINMIRFKLKLPPIKEDKKNIMQPYYVALEKDFKLKYSKVNRIKTDYLKNYNKDIFLKYYSSDRNFTEKIDMEEKNKLKYRFVAWEIKK